MKAFIDKLFAAAKFAGFTAAEAFLLEDESFEAVAVNQEINQYSSHQTRGLGFRAMLNGRMGYAATEAFDDAAIAQLIRGATDSATLCEDPSEQFIFDGKQPDPKLDLYNEALDGVPVQAKLDFALAMERAAKAYDKRIEQVGYTTIVTGRQNVRLINTNGLDKSYAENYCTAYTQPVAHDGESIATGFYALTARDFAKLNAQAIADRASEIAVSSLHATSVPSGKYRVLFDRLAMTDLLSTFSGVFSAENAQKDLSLLKGKLGETIAAPCVTIVDDPLRADGFACRPFDAEGVPSSRHTVVDGGVFRTFLHNLNTARKDGVETTGNASKAGYAASVRVAPTNFFIEPGAQSPADVMQVIGDGLLITEVEGLHAGANAVSGDFSLLAKGYRVTDGKRGAPVEQITVAGNFLELLKGVQTVCNDLIFDNGGVECPSLYVGELSVAGKSEN